MPALQLVLCLRSCCSCYNESTAAAHVHIAKSFFLCPAVELNAGTAAGPVFAQLLQLLLSLHSCCSCYNVNTAAAHVHLAKSFFLCPAVELNAGTAAGPAVANAALVGVLVANIMHTVVRYVTWYHG